MHLLKGFIAVWLRVFAWLVFIFLLWQLWVFLKPRPREYSVPELNAIRNVSLQEVERLAGKLEGPLRIGVAHLANDPTDAATLILRSVLATRKEWTVEEQSPIQKFLVDVSKAVSEATSIDEVVHAGRRVELDVIIAGRVVTVEKMPNDAAQAAIQFYVYDVRTGQWVTKDIVAASWYPNVADKMADGVRRASPRVRVAVWLCFVLLLPWVTAFATHRTLEKKSNLAGFILILLYTLLDVALAMALAATFSGLGNMKTLALFAGVAAYNYWACETIAHRAK